MIKQPAVPTLLPIRTIKDERGALGVVEAMPDIGFVFRRLYFLYNIQNGLSRGAHAHKELRQFMIAMNGSFTVRLRGRGKDFEFRLDNPQQGLFIPSGYWRDLTDFSSGAVCLVAASEEYDEKDYIRNYEDFLVWETQIYES